ncbi:MAG: beta strand repeat-containing protein [Cyanobacteriota bacterium]
MTIDAEAMDADSTFALSGTATFAATDLQANADASGTSGEVTLSYGAVSDGAAEITTGSGTTTISGTEAGDQLVIDASKLDASATLSQSGAADQLVSGLVGDISATGLSGELTVTTGNAVDDQISISTGSADSTISASGTDDVVTIDAGAMGADSTLALSGTATFAATDLQANTDASGTSAEVTLSYGAVSDGAAEITTGSGTTTISGTEAGDQLVIDASKLDASATLSQSGAADQLVSGLVGDISASGLSGELTVTTGNAADDQISISTGSADSTISASGAGDVVTIDAGSMDADSTLALSGTATFAATELEANTDASGTSGEVMLSYGAVSDGAAEIKTGSGTTTISGTEAGDQVVIDASKLDASATLSQSGAADQLVSGLVGDISASGLSGELTVTTGNAADDQISISTGAADSTISASGAGDVVNVDAEQMAAESTLDLSGSATFEITDVVANIDASGSSGAVVVTTGDALDNAISITAGTSNTSITSISTTDTISVDANGMADSTILDLNGTVTYTVSNLEANTNAADTTGTVSLSYGEVTDNSAFIKIGSGSTTVSGTSKDDTLSIDASAQPEENSLIQAGAAQQVVTSLVGDIDATGLTGSLTVTTGNASDNAITIATGTGNTTITANGSSDTITVNSDGMADSTTLDLNGNAFYTVSNLEANTNASDTAGTVILSYGDVTDNIASITTGSGAIAVSSSTSGDTLAINAVTLAQNTTLTQSGAAEQVVTGLVGDIDATGLTGSLTVTTGNATDNGVKIATGTGNTTIIANGSNDTISVNADGMADGTTLDLKGSAAYTVSNLEANTNLADTTGAVSLTYNVLTDKSASITTGSGAISVGSSTNGDTLTIDAATLAQNTTLTQMGNADQVVTNLVGDIDASGLTGSLTVTTENASDNALAIATGTGNTTITANASSDTITVNSDGMADGTTLDINGLATYTVSNLEANTNAADSKGTVTLAYTDITDNAAAITTGSGATTVSGTTAGDTLTIDATALSYDTTLTESGAARQVVNNLVGDINASGLTGALVVTTGDNTDDNIISITSGSANTTVTANASNDSLIVNADTMADNRMLDLNGSSTFTVSNLEGNTNASDTSGTVSLAYGDVSDNVASVITGSGATTVSSTTAADTLTINATVLDDDTLLTQSGAAQQVVNNLIGDINAAGLTGSLTVSTGDNSDDDEISITTGSADTNITGGGSDDTVIIEADGMLDNKSLDLNGSSIFTVINLEANADAAGTSSTVSLAYSNVSDDAASITTGSGAINLSGSDTSDTLTIDASLLQQNVTFTGSGNANQVLNQLVGDVSAKELAGTLSVTTGNAIDNSISITTGSADTSISATGSEDTIVVDADVMLDNTNLDLSGSATYVVSSLEANADASASSGNLFITYTDNNDDSSTLVTGSGNIVINGGDRSDSVIVTGLASNLQTFNALDSDSSFSVTAGSGNQIITGSRTGNDTMDGGAGSGDILSYFGGSAVDTTITGYLEYSGVSTGQGEDSFISMEMLVGSASTDRLQGVTLEGVDETFTLTGSNVGSASSTGAGYSFAFSSYEQLVLNGGDDSLKFSGSAGLSSIADGGDGIDTLDYSSYSVSGVSVDLSSNTATGIFGDLVGEVGDSSFENVDGSASADAISGDDTGNILRGFTGSDFLSGMVGDDTIDGGDGTSGADGADVIAGGEGSDLILASDGNDFISGGGFVFEASYQASADQDIDTLSYSDENEGLDITLTGIDKGIVKADAGASLSISAFINTITDKQVISVPTNQATTDWTQVYGDIQSLILSSQNDILRLDASDFNTGNIDAGSGNLDTLDYSSFTTSSPVYVNLSDSRFSFDFDANGKIDTSVHEITLSKAYSATNIGAITGGANGVANFEVVIGGAGEDALVGNSSENLLVGNAGDDRIAGGAGNDTIYGGEGDDFIIPGSGSDTVEAGSGYNTILITTQDWAEDNINTFNPNGINTLKLEGDATQTTAINVPTSHWDPGSEGISLLDGGDPVPVDDGSGSTAVVTYDTIYGTVVDDTFQLSGIALKNIESIDLGTGNDYISTAATTKGIKVTYDGNSGTDTVTLNLTFSQFAKLNQSSLYVPDVQSYLEEVIGKTFSSTQADFSATGFEHADIAVITPGVFNALQGDPAALTFNSAYGVRNSTLNAGDDIALSATALTTSTATALSAGDIVSAFVQANEVKGSDSLAVSTGGSISGTSSADQDASASARTVDDRADSVLAAYSIGTDRSSFTAADDLTLTFSGRVKADTVAESGAFVANANGTMETAGSRDTSIEAADALSLTITASGQQTVSATNTEGVANAGLASRAYGIDDAGLTDASEDSVQAGTDLRLSSTASTTNLVTAQTVGNESLGTINLVDPGVNTDRFTTSLTGAAFPLINGDRVRFSSSNGSVQADRDYYVLNVIQRLGQFQLSSEPNGDPITVVAAGSLQAYRPAAATADAISTVTGVDLNRSGASRGGVQAGDELTLTISASDAITATATSTSGEATAGLQRLGSLDGLNLAADVSSIIGMADTISLAGSKATLNLSARDVASLRAASTVAGALTEANAQVFGSKNSSTTTGTDLDLNTSASLNLSGTASSTGGSAEARSGAGAGAGVTTPGYTLNDTGMVQPNADTFALVTALSNGNQAAGVDLTLLANASANLIASASTVSGSGSLGSLWTSTSGNLLATFDLNLDTTSTTPSFIGPQLLAEGQLVQLDAAAAGATGLTADTDYAVKLLGFGAVNAADDTITMPTGITYALNDAVRFRLNSTVAPNAADSRYGIALGTTYYVLNPTGNRFKLAASPGGLPINLTADSLGQADQLVDADRFQLLTPPIAPGGTYRVAALTGGVSGVSLIMPAVANAFAGSREADLTLNANGTLNLAQVKGISGSRSLTTVTAGDQTSLTALADGLLKAVATNIGSDATASAGMVAEGISDVAISAGGNGTVTATALINAVADAVTVGDSASLDNALANLNITASGVSASDAANDISIGGVGDVVASASLAGRSTAVIVDGASDSLAVLQATGLEALSNSFTITIGQQGDIGASAMIGAMNSPLLVSASSGAVGDATAQVASDAIGILGSYNAGSFSITQAGFNQGDINSTASANLQLRAIATDGAASVVLSDVSGSGSSTISGIQNMALTAGADLSQINATATGVASLLAQSVNLDATSQGSTVTSGLLSSALTALPVSFLDQGSIAAIANQRSFSQAVSVAGSSSSDLYNRTVGMANASLNIAGIATIAADAFGQQESRAQSVAGNVSA